MDPIVSFNILDLPCMLHQYTNLKFLTSTLEIQENTRQKVFFLTGGVPPNFRRRRFSSHSRLRALSFFRNSSVLSEN